MGWRADEAEACGAQRAEWAREARQGLEALPGTQRTLMPTWYSRTFFRARTCMWLDTWGGVPHHKGKQVVRRHSQDGQGGGSTQPSSLGAQDPMGELRHLSGYMTIDTVTMHPLFTKQNPSLRSALCSGRQGLHLTQEVGGPEASFGSVAPSIRCVPKPQLPFIL